MQFLVVNPLSLNRKEEEKKEEKNLPKINKAQLRFKINLYN